MPTPNLPARCRHLHTDGRQCGSPALRGQPLCYQHRAARQPLPVKTLEARFLPQLPIPDDFPAIQRGIAEVLRLLAEEEITDARASTLFRGLALASQNLARSLREARRQHAEAPSDPVTDLVNHPEFGPLALEDPSEPTHVPETSIQQNQDLSGIDEGLSRTAAPTPATRFTPYSSTTHADDFRLAQRFQQLEHYARERRLAFTHEKTAELEAQFNHKLEQALEIKLAEHLPKPALQPQPQLTAA